MNILCKRLHGPEDNILVKARMKFLKKIKTFGLKQTMFAVRRAAKPTYTTTVHKSYKNKAIKNGIQFNGSARHCDHFAGALGGFPVGER